MNDTPFRELAELCMSLEATTKKTEKTTLISLFLKRLDPEEVSPAILLIIGAVFPEFDPRSLDIGWKTVKKVIKGGKQTTLFKRSLSIKRVYQFLADIGTKSGPGSRKVKVQLLEGLINSANKTEVDIIVRIIFGEMRIGVNEGVMLEAISEASEAPLALINRALMMTGNIGEVGKVALTKGKEGLNKIDASLFIPLKPMLATMVADPDEAITEYGGETAFEYKYDGARIQIHKRNGEVRIYSRRLSDVTDSLPDIVELVKHNIKNRNIILEGEVFAIGENDKPLPFQDLMRRFTRVNDVVVMVEKVPLHLKLFDILYEDGELQINEPYFKRWEKLSAIAPTYLLAERIVTSNPIEAESFLEKAFKEGHEGLMAKKLDSAYTTGSRGKLWSKIKSLETLDVVITAADWGTGRRRGWLSNYHLAAWSGEEYLVIGKTFKGLTDAEFNWITKKLLSIKELETEHTVYVKPELVVEVAFNEIQKSPHYKSGYALRFARVTRIREDKSPNEANTLEKVDELYERQFKYKAKL